MSKHVEFRYQRPDGAYDDWVLDLLDHGGQEIRPVHVDRFGAVWHVVLDDDVTEFRYLLHKPGAPGEQDPPRPQRDRAKPQSFPLDGTHTAIRYPAGFADRGVAKALVLPDNEIANLLRLLLGHIDAI